jgi:hypothetical protein
MNRSYSKIRHIQESNQRLERRLLNEQLTGGAQTTTQNEVTWESFKERVKNGISTFDYWTLYPKKWGDDPEIETFKYPQMKYSGYKFVGSYPQGDENKGIEELQGYATKINGDNIFFKTRIGNDEKEFTITKK